MRVKVILLCQANRLSGDGLSILAHGAGTSVLSGDSEEAGGLTCLLITARALPRRPVRADTAQSAHVRKRMGTRPLVLASSAEQNAPPGTYRPRQMLTMLRLRKYVQPLLRKTPNYERYGKSRETVIPVDMMCGLLLVECCPYAHLMRY